MPHFEPGAGRLRFSITFFILFGFWLLLSGHYDPLHLGLGAACSLLVSALCRDLLLEDASLGRFVGGTVRFLAYLPWLLYQILVSNLDVAYRVLHPRKPLEPEIITFPTNLDTDFGRVTLANSITLTPGTVTIDIKDGEYIVHTISKASADSLRRGLFQARVKKLET